MPIHGNGASQNRDAPRRHYLTDDPSRSNH
jgi:hypothetical protein